MRRLGPLLLALALAATACSGKQKVGSDKLLDFKERESKRLGEISRSPSPQPRTSSSARASSAPASVRPTSAAPTATATSVPTVTVTITSEAYQPFSLRVFQGSKVVFVNRDGQARTATADKGAFDSKAIPPGKSWTWVASRAGTFDYHDTTRPFVVGQLEVVPR